MKFFRVVATFEDNSSAIPKTVHYYQAENIYEVAKELKEDGFDSYSYDSITEIEVFTLKSEPVIKVKSKK